MEGPDNSPIYKIAAEISNADAKLLSDISECLIHTSDYFHKHLVQHFLIPHTLSTRYLRHRRVVVSQ